jgi:acetyl esterase/lipase
VAMTGAELRETNTIIEREKLALMATRTRMKLILPQRVHSNARIAFSRQGRKARSTHSRATLCTAVSGERADPARSTKALGIDSMDNFRDGKSQSPLPALWVDPPEDLTYPARTLPQAIRSCSVNLNAVLYQASGPGPHPTALLLHGLPGNEQNLDCAQSLRRSGCNVLTIHYRGSWGSPGAFTIANCLSDAAAALKWLRDAANDRKLRIDPRRLVVVGHSVGGFVAAHLASENLASSARR